MVTLDKAIMATYDKEGEHFEVYVDPDKAYQYLEGSKKDLKNILVVEEVFRDAKKGDRAKSGALQKAFGTTDLLEVLKIILKKGQVQLTTEQKRKKGEEIRAQIIDIICREGIDARTKAPIPPTRLENALEQIRFKVDISREPREQANEIVKKLLTILPVKFEKLEVAVRIPPEFAHRSYGTMKMYGIRKEQWLKDGSLVVVVEIPAGTQGEFYDRVNKLTAGRAETKVVER